MRKAILLSGTWLLLPCPQLLPPVELQSRWDAGASGLGCTGIDKRLAEGKITPSTGQIFTWASEGQSTWADQTPSDLQEKTKVIACTWAGGFMVRFHHHVLCLLRKLQHPALFEFCLLFLTAFSINKRNWHQYM